MSESRQRPRRRYFHLFVDLLGMNIQRASKDERKSQHIVHLIRIITAPRADDGIGSRLFGEIIFNFRIRVRHSEDDRVLRHRLHPLRFEQVGDREPEKHIGVFHRIGKCALRRIHNEALFIFVHTIGATFVDHALCIHQAHILALHAEPNVKLGASNRARARARYHDF